MSNEIWVLAEQRDGYLADVSIELVGKATELARQCKGKVASIIMGEKLEQVAKRLISCGSDEVYIFEDHRFRFYQCDMFSDIITDLVRQYEPEVIIGSATVLGQDLAATIAARLKTGLTAHCTDLYLQDNDGKFELIQLIPGFEGRVLYEITCPGKRPQIATIKPGVLPKPQEDAGRKGSINRVPFEIRNERIKTKVIEVLDMKASGRPLEEADIVICGGWGLKSVGGFELIEDLAKALQAAVGGTRPAVDAGWIPEDKMIGQSGKTVQPKLFISAGASGAMHYVTGFQNSKVILAIDKNPNAPIFQVADIGLVGCAGEIIPQLKKELIKLVSHDLV